MKVNPKNMDSPVLFQAGAGTRGGQCPQCPPSATSQVTSPFATALPSPALLPPDGKGRGAERPRSLCDVLGMWWWQQGLRDTETRGLGDSGPSSAAADAGGNPGQQQEPVQGWHGECGPGFTPAVGTTLGLRGQTARECQQGCPWQEHPELPVWGCFRDGNAGAPRGWH